MGSPCKASLPALLLSLAVVTLAAAGDWPQWRGPGRDGTADGFKAPATWPEKLTKVWSVPIGEGHSSPVVAGDRVYTFSREADQEVARALRLADGGEIWKQAAPVGYQMHSAATGHGKGPKSTPVIAAGRLYTFGISGILSAFDAATGAARWRREYASEFKTTSPLFGAANSPLLDAGAVILYVGGHHDGSLVALDTATGALRWSLKGDGPGYASAIIAELAGKRQIITQSDKRIVGVDPATGALLWSLPFTTPYDQNSVTPVVAGGLLITSGIDQGVHAWTLDTKEKALVPREVWSRREASFYMSTPVVVGTRLIGYSHLRRGQYVCMEVKTGEFHWASEGRSAENAALVVAGSHVLGLTDDGDLVVLRPDASQFSPVAQYRVAESPTWAHPVPTSEGLLIKDKTHLTLWKLVSAQAASGS